jgi:hypothetical protein
MLFLLHRLASTYRLGRTYLAHDLHFSLELTA